MKHYSLFFSAIFMLVLSSSNAQYDAELDAIFTSKIDPKSKSPGVAVAIVKNRKVVYKRTFGMANLEYDIPISSKSVFDIASLAKQFTGFAVAKLILEKKLTMETAVVDLIPELENFPREMKIKHLIHHTSGVRDIGELFTIGGYGEKLTSVEALNILKRQRGLNFALGSESDYSNSNYVLLALAVERVTQQSFRSYCDEHIFQPLDMQHSFANDNFLELIPNRAVAYYTKGDNYSYMQNNGMSLIGSSAVYATIDDMVKWAIAMEGGNSFDPIINLMKTDGHTNDGSATGYGFGIGIGTYRGLPQFEHTGATPSGFRSVISWFPTEQLSVVLLSNWGNLNLIDDFGRELINKFIEFEDKKSDNSEANKGAKREAVAATKEELNLAVGKYLFNNEMPLEIKRERSALTIVPGGQEPAPLIPLGDHQFDFPAFHSLLQFKPDDDGKYQMAVVYAGPNRERHGILQRIDQNDQGDVVAERYKGHYYSEELSMLLQVDEIEGQLVINSEKHGIIELHSNSRIHFRPNGLASSIEFGRNQGGEINGFQLSRGNRMREVSFVKVAIPR